MLSKYTVQQISFFIFLLFPAIQCKKEVISDNTYFNSKVMILGHRGMGVLYNKPHNTFESISPVIGIGADGAEVDVQLTKDSVLVLFHDQLLNPTTTCNGRIYDYTWVQVKECKFYAFENMIFVNSADELFAKLPSLNKVYFSFDCKIDSQVQNFDEYQGQYLIPLANII